MSILFIYLSTYLFLFLAAPGLSCGMHAGSSSLTRDRTWAPCIGSAESYPLDHQGYPQGNALSVKNNGEMSTENARSVIV